MQKVIHFFAWICICTVKSGYVYISHFVYVGTYSACAVLCGQRALHLHPLMRLHSQHCMQEMFSMLTSSLSPILMLKNE